MRLRRFFCLALGVFLLAGFVPSVFAQAQASLVATVAGPVSAPNGSNFVYTVTIVNNGPADASGARFDNTFPAGATNLAITCAVPAGNHNFQFSSARSRRIANLSAICSDGLQIISTLISQWMRWRGALR